MFYGKVNSEAGGNGGGRGNRNERYDQMVKQQQLIEQKKMEIQARLEMERQKKEMEALSKPSSSGGCPSSNVPSTTSSLRSEPEEEQKPVVQVQNFFSNDGSFFEQFKKMQEEAAKKQKEDDEKAAAFTKKIKEEPIDYDEYGTPINKKPPIKFINPDAVGRSTSPGHRGSPHEISGVSGSYGSGNQPQKNYYNVPPPPPPPPPKVSTQMQQDIKPFVFGGINNPSGFQAVPPPPPPPPPPIGGPTPKQFGWVPTPQVRALASIVAEQGDHIEEELKRKHEGDPLMWFLLKPDSTEYRTFRALVAEMKSDIKTHLYNSAPPPPPPPSIAKVKFEPPSQVKFEPKSEPFGFHGGEMGIKREFQGGEMGIKREFQGGEMGIKREFQGGEMGIKREFQGGEMGIKREFQGGEMGIKREFQGGEMGIKREFQGGDMGVKREAPSPDPDSDESESERRERKRRSRWGPQASDVPPVGVAIPPPGVAPVLISSSAASSVALLPHVAGRSSSPVGINLMSMPLMPVASGSGALAKVTRTNPQLVAYAKQAYGRVDLDEDEWKQCEEAYKMNLVFQDIARKKAKNEEIEKAGKFKHEYDSDEETDGGTWEHKQRMKEMEKTREWADDLTKKAHGKHHIGDFLPPDELSKFMEKYKAVKEGKILDESEYQEYKIQQDNIGFKMLQKMGWSSGEGLGASGQGITAPIDKGNAVGDKQGLGNEKPGDLNEEDDEYTAYRKRMMLAYRFRPNPLNNPRRAYY